MKVEEAGGTAPHPLPRASRFRDGARYSARSASRSMVDAPGVEPDLRGFKPSHVPLCYASMKWRREWDLNPRGCYPALFSKEARSAKLLHLAEKGYPRPGGWGRCLDRHGGMSPARRCVACKEVKALAEFRENRTRGRVYTRGKCAACEDLDRTIRARAHTNRRVRMKPQRVDRAEWRAEPVNRPDVIVADARRADRKRGHLCEVTREAVAELLIHGCAYCGATTNLGLDRIDNAQGHTLSNVRACCTRCNYIKRDMPDAAWLVLAPAVRAAHEAGLFGSWHAGGWLKREKTSP